MKKLWSRSKGRCKFCDKDTRRVIYPTEGKFRFEARCAECNNWIVKHENDPRFYADRSVKYVE